MIIMLSQLLVVAVVEVGAELGKRILQYKCGVPWNRGLLLVFLKKISKSGGTSTYFIR